MGEGTNDGLEVYRQEAWDTLFGVDFWFRREYKLAPTDPRYLNATRSEMIVEFLRYELLERYREAKKEGRAVNSLADLTADEDFDKQLAEFDKKLAEEAAKKVSSIGDDDRDVLINVKAPPFNGNR